MQTENDLGSNSNSSKKEKQNQKINNPHFVYITDEDGIFSVFNAIKLKLSIRVNCSLSLVYSIHKQLTHPLFKSELKCLERQFPTHLLIYYVINKNNSVSDNSDTHQQTLEVIINSNISNKVKFLLSGENEFVEFITNRLLFLGIKQNQISINN